MLIFRPVSLSIREYPMSSRLAPFALVFLVYLAFSPIMALSSDDETGMTSRLLTDNWGFRASGALVYLKTDVSAGSGLGALIDVEDVLGFDEEVTTLNVEGMFRFTENRKHSVRFNYISLDRAASTVVEGSVPIFDLEFVGAVDSEFDNTVVSLAYQYSFVNNGTTEAGFLAGLGFYSFRFAIDGEVVIDDDPTQSQFASEQTSVLAPVPTIGIFVQHALTPNLILELRTSFIDLEISEHNGRIFNSLANLTWFFSRHVGVNFGLGATDITYSQKNNDLTFKVDYVESSIEFGLTAVF